MLTEEKCAGDRRPASGASDRARPRTRGGTGAGAASGAAAAAGAKGRSGASGAKGAAGARRESGLRERIVDAARELCFASGLNGISARKIAASIGCSATAIYLHFDSIEHVLHEIRMEGHALLVGYLSEPPASLPAIERLCAMQQAYHRFGTENPSYFRVMFSSRVDAAALGQLVTSEGASLDVVRAAAALGIERGEFRKELDPRVVANLSWMSVHGLTSMVVSGHAAVTAPGLQDRLLDSLTEATRAWLRTYLPATETA